MGWCIVGVKVFISDNDRSAVYRSCWQLTVRSAMGSKCSQCNNAWSFNDNGIQASHEDFADFSYGTAFKPQFSTNVVTGYTADGDERVQFCEATSVASGMVEQH